MNNDQSELSIRIPDLCAAFLKRIKPIFILVLVFTLLGCLFGVYRATHAGSRVSEEDLRAAETALLDAKNSVSSAEASLRKLLEVDIPKAENDVERARLQVQRRQEYVDNSLYFAMNPFHRGVSRVTLYVEADLPVNPDAPWLTADPRNIIALAYTKLYPFDSELLESIQRIMNTDADPAYISELVKVVNNSDQFVEICVYHDDAETAKKVTDYLLEMLQDRLSKTVSDFSANVIAYFVGYEVDWDMSDSHDKEADRLLSAQAALFTAEQNLQTLKINTKASAEQTIEDNKAAAAQAEEDLQKLQERSASAAATPKNILKKAVLFAVVFFAVGLFGACFLVCLEKLLSGQLQNVNDALTRYSFPVIGIIPAKKKRLFEKTIRKLEGEPELDFETAGKATAQSLLSVVGDRRIALVSSEGPDTVQEFLPFVGERIPVCGDLLRDADAVKAAKDYDGFVLVEKRGKSRFDLIDAEVRRIQALGKQTEGIILL